MERGSDPNRHADASPCDHHGGAIRPDVGPYDSLREFNAHPIGWLPAFLSRERSPYKIGIVMPIVAICVVVWLALRGDGELADGKPTIVFMALAMLFIVAITALIGGIVADVKASKRTTQATESGDEPGGP